MSDTAAPPVDTTLSHRPWVGRMLRVPVGTGTIGGVVSVVIQLAACLTVSWLAGGTAGVAPYWYLLPIVFAALRFGVGGALLTSGAAAILAGPVTATVVGAAHAQSTEEQIVQALAFVVVGAGLALVVERTVEDTRSHLSSSRLGDRVAAAIERGDVGVEFQPIWAPGPDGEELIGAEVLVRWVDAEHGAVPPGTFIPVLEETDRLDELGGWVLDEACRNLAAWQTGRAGTDRPFHVAVNVSGVQVGEDLPALVAGLIERHGIDPGGLVLELTERTVLGDRATALPVLARIRDLGVRIAVDDFGTGYSSLAYLRDLDFDILKLDRAFIDALGTNGTAGDAVDLAIVGAVVQLAERLGKEVVVEGVESPSQLEQVRALGPVGVQGSLLSPPVSAEVMAERLDGRRAGLGAGAAPSAPPTRAASVGSRISGWMRREATSDGSARGEQPSNPAHLVLAGMFLAGALLTIAVVLFSDGEGETAKLAIGLAALPCALLLHSFREQVPVWMLHALLLVGTAMVVAATATDPVDTTMVASSAFLIWVTVYASAFFDLRLAVAHGVIAGVAFGLVLHFRPVEQGAAVWLIVLGTAGVAGFLVGWFAGQLRALAATDPLTGLPNRETFEALLVTEIDRAQRADAPLSLGLVDLDDFKAINDTEGHQAGDRVLAALPSRWRAELRTHDVLARYGGDEFIVLLPSCPLDDAEDALARMSRAGHPTCSVGVVTLAWGETPATLLARADAALYRAKSQRAMVRADRSVPPEHAVGGSGRQAHPAGSARGQ